MHKKVSHAAKPRKEGLEPLGDVLRWLREGTANAHNGRKFTQPEIYDEWQRHEREFRRALGESDQNRSFTNLSEYQKKTRVIEWEKGRDAPSSGQQAIIEDYYHLPSGSLAWLSDQYDSSLRDLLASPLPLARAVTALRDYLGTRTPPTGDAAEAPTAPARDRSYTNLRQNLPELVHRDTERENVWQLISRHPLVTLIGSGGIGKTVLAERIGMDHLADFPDGVWFADFTKTFGPEHLPTIVSLAIGVTLRGDVPADKALASALAGRKSLLIFDNCEHVLEGVAQLVETLLNTVPHVRILATSRQGIGVTREKAYLVEELSCPREEDDIRTVADVMRFGAASLFALYAGSSLVMHDTQARILASICRLLNGVPLSLEIAAFRVRELGLSGLHDELSAHILKILERRRKAVVERQRSVEATLDWSYQLLSEAEQRVFRCLAVFAGGFTLTAVRRVVASGAQQTEGIDPFGRLVDLHLVSQERVGEFDRYRLHETTREYASAKLESLEERHALDQGHAAWVLSTMSSCFDDWTCLGDQEFFDRYAAELENLRAAIRWSFGRQGDSQTGVALVASSSELWWLLSLFEEQQRNLEVAVKVATPTTPVLVSAALARSESWFFADPDPVRSIHAGEHAVCLYRQAADRLGLAASLRLLYGRYARQGRKSDAEAIYSELDQLLSELGRPRPLVSHYLSTGTNFINAANAPRALHYFGMALDLARESGIQESICLAATGRAEALWMQGKLSEAIAEAARSVEEARRHRFTNRRNLGLTLCVLFGVLVESDDRERVRWVSRDLIELAREYALSYKMLDSFSLRAVQLGKHDVAAIIAGYATALFQQKNTSRDPNQSRLADKAQRALRSAVSRAALQTLFNNGASMPERYLLQLIKSECT